MKLRMRASDLGSMMGLGRKSQLALFREMQMREAEGVDPIEIEDDDAIAGGRIFEAPIAELTARRQGLEIVEGPKELLHESGMLVGHPDCYVQKDDGPRAVMEVKYVFDHQKASQWGPSGSDKVPIDAYLQELAYTIIENAEQGYVAGWIAGVGLRFYTIPRDQEIEDTLLNDVDAFLERIKRDNPPDPIDEQDARIRWFAKREKTARMDGYLGQMVALVRLREQIKIAKDAEKRVVFDLIKGLADAGTGLVQNEAGVDVEMLYAKNNRILDIKSLERDHPRLVEKHRTKIDLAALKKDEPKVYEKYFREPTNVLEATRVIKPTKHLKEIAERGSDA
jgi:predicted phage-related endonuclease